MRLTVVAWTLTSVLTVACSTPSSRHMFADRNANALAEAAGRGDRQMAARLLAEGTRLTTRGDGDITLLQSMLLRRSLRGFEILLDLGADPAQPGIDGDTSVHLAAAADNPAYLSVLLARGVAPDVRNSRSGRTPLMAAMMAERDRQFDMLVKAGADPGVADAMGNTALHVAAQINDPGRILDLLEAGAPPGTRNRQGQTFQRYLSMADPELLSGQAKEYYRAVTLWLIRHKVPVELRLPGR